MQESGLVSIITPMYNSAAFVGETIQSVLAQTYSRWELLIVDDCSSDNSTSIVREFAALDPRIRLLSNEKNSGTAVTRNHGLREAQGSYIAFLDSDDLWMPEKLEYQLATMKKDGVALSCTAYNMIDESGQILKPITPPHRITFDTMLRTNYIACSTAVVARDVIGEQTFRDMKWEDYVFWLETLGKCKIAVGIDRILMQYRVRRNAYSANKFRNLGYQWKVYRDFLKFSPGRAAYFMFHYILNGIYKHYMP